MKKWSLFLLALVLLMPACEPQEKVEQAIEPTQEVEESEEAPEATEIPISEQEVSKDVTEELTTKYSIEITNPVSGTHFTKEPVVFTGTVSPNAIKIVVTASYYDNVFEDTERSTDVYTLSEFKPGDTTFTYRAKHDWNNLGFSENDYLFTAYFDDGSQKAVNTQIIFDAEELVGQPY